jgi:hypothetical protein
MMTYKDIDTRARNILSLEWNVTDENALKKCIVEKFGGDSSAMLNAMKFLRGVGKRGIGSVADYIDEQGWDFHAKIKADITTLPTTMLLQELLRREGCQEEYSEWHSAKEMMPSDSEDVIVLKKNGCISFAHRVSCLDEVQNWDGWNISGVAFWMPFRPSKEMLEYYDQETDLK